MSVLARWENAVKKNGTTYDVVLRESRVWSCKVHDAPQLYDGDYDEDGNEIDFDFPVYGCTCDTRARWEPIINLDGSRRTELALEGVLSRILRDIYLPQIRQLLNTESILVNKLLTGD